MDNCKLCNRNLDSAPEWHGFGEGFICGPCHNLSTESSLCSHAIEQLAEVVAMWPRKSDGMRAVRLVLNSPALKDKLAEIPEEAWSR